MGCCTRKCGICSLMSVGGIFITLGVCFALFWNTLYKGILVKELVLTNTSRSYELWKETPIPIYLDIFMFNWTNAQEVIQSKWTVKPEFKECGPYVFSEHHTRVNVTWNPNGTVSFQQVRTWQFIPSMSNGSLTDNITNVNPIVTVIGNKVKTLPNFLKKAINGLLNFYEEKIYLTKSIDELIFTGYEDPILAELHKLHIPLPFTRFGWFYLRNNSDTYDGRFTMNTGKTDLNLLGIVNLWNGLSNTNIYNGSCGVVNGTTGELWPPVEGVEQIEIFSSDLCSRLSFQHNGSDSICGITGKKFIGTDFTFDNGTKYPEQACYRGDKIVPSGVRNISKCKFGAPAFISYPHFYLADPSYVAAVKGLQPNRTKHESHVTLEPISGIPLNANAQMQLNIYLESIDGMSIFSNIKPTYMPMLWFRQRATLIEEYCNMTNLLVKLSGIPIYVGWAMFAVGFVMTIMGFALLYRKDLMEDDEEHLIECEE